MSHQPIQYPRPAPPGTPTPRRVFRRIAWGAWALFACAFIFLILNGGARDRLQWPAAIFAGGCPLAALALTTFYWLVLVPLLYFRGRRARLKTL